jgi:UDP-N-acetylmuramyl pentapeptide synthase
VTFGLAEDADYRATDVVHRGIEGSHFQLLTPGGSQRRSSLQLAGEQHVKNALAALAIAIEIGVQPSDAGARLTDRWRGGWPRRRQPICPAAAR